VSDLIFLVTALDVVAVRHLSIAFRTLLSLGVPQERFRVLLNRSDSKVGLSVAEVEKVMRIRVEAGVPSSRLVPLALNNGQPVFLREPKSPVAKSFAELAEKVVALAEAPAPAPAGGRHRRSSLRRRRGA
jgi:pilus assembly protein CpaE